MVDSPKILILDIEWRPVLAYVWRAWDETIQPDQIVEDGGLLCVGVKWLGDKRPRLFSEWEHGHESMLEEVHKLLSEADAVVTYNGDKYDLPKLQGEFLLYDFDPPPPPTSIDLIKTIKKMGFFRNALGFIGPFLGVGRKLEHEGFMLWRKVLAGDKKAKVRMSKYCIQDIKMTEALYNRIKPFIPNHPALRAVGAEVCPSCHSKHTQRRGFRYTRYFQIRRHQCNSCGAWFSGKRKKVA